MSRYPAPPELADGASAATMLDALSASLGEPAPEHLQFLAEVAPASLEGYYRLFRELLRDPDEGGSLPKRYKALIIVSLANYARNRDAGILWSRVAVRWGLKFEELRETVCFSITGIGMSRFQEVGQYCLREALAQSTRDDCDPNPVPMPAFQTPVAWHSRALAGSEVPLAERPAILPPGDEKQAAIHAYFEKSFNAPMPEFWARLGRDNTAILEGYYHLRRETMKRPEEGGACPKVVKELAAVAADSVLTNPWGGEAHLRAAMLNGATMADVREVQGLVIMETGMVAYKMQGFDFLVRAEHIAEELARP